MADEAAVSERIRVAVRVRPLREEERSRSSAVESARATDDHVVAVTDPAVVALLSPGGMPAAPPAEATRLFWFDHAFGPDATQEAVHHAVGRWALRAFYDGFNTSVLAYGPTGAGKSHTIMGTGDAWASAEALHTERSGLIPRMCFDLFRRLRRDSKSATPTASSSDHWPVHGVASLCVSYVEIYDERIFDLLAEAAVSRSATPRATPSSAAAAGAAGAGMSSAKQALRVREAADGTTFVEGVTERVVHSIADVEQAIVDGSRARSIAETTANVASSRSHAIFTLRLRRRHEGRVVSSKLVVVDLAGSESQRATAGTTAATARARESRSINSSLSALGIVIRALANNTTPAVATQHVPYRNSALTWLLKDSIGGSARTLMLANVSPAATAYPDTLSAIKYVQTARFIGVEARARVDMERAATTLFPASAPAPVVVAPVVTTSSDEIAELRAEVSDLRSLVTARPPAEPSQSHEVARLHAELREAHDAAARTAARCATLEAQVEELSTALAFERDRTATLRRILQQQTNLTLPDTPRRIAPAGDDDLTTRAPSRAETVESCAADEPREGGKQQPWRNWWVDASAVQPFESSIVGLAVRAALDPPPGIEPPRPT